MPLPTKRRRLKSIRAANNYEQDEQHEMEFLPELPLELLEMIISQLTLRDNIRASVVCKKWFTAAISVRVVNKHPWLMFCPKSRDFVELYDPLQRKFYHLELPDLPGSRICYAKDGWLLIYKPITQNMMFMNPYTRESIQLPTFQLNYQVIVFSAAPTSPHCFVFIIKHISPAIVAISTWHPGATQWTSTNHLNHLPFVSSMWNKVVFSNGLFYCLSLTGWLGVYDRQNHTWVVNVLPPPSCPENFFVNNWWKSKFMAEHDGEIYIVYTSRDFNPVLYKLDKTCKEWVLTKTLGGLTFFASFLSSHIKTNLLGELRNRAYFSKVRFYGKRCISYSLDCRYYPRKQYYDRGEDDPFGSIWVEPPEDLSVLA